MPYNSKTQLYPKYFLKKNFSSYFAILITFEINGFMRSIPAFLDSGADFSFMSLKLANKLGLKLSICPSGLLANGSRGDRVVNFSKGANWNFQCLKRCFLACRDVTWLIGMIRGGWKLS